MTAMAQVQFDAPLIGAEICGSWPAGGSHAGAMEPLDAATPRRTVPGPPVKDGPSLGGAPRADTIPAAALPPSTGARGESTSVASILSALQVVEDQLGQAIEHQHHSLRELQAVSIELAVAISGRIIGQELASHPEHLAAHVESLLGGFDVTQPLDVFLHPSDLAELQPALSASASAAGRACRWHGDPALSRGSCRVDGPTYSRLRHLDLMLAELRHQLLEQLNDVEVERRTAEANDRGLRRFPDRRAAV